MTEHADIRAGTGRLRTHRRIMSFGKEIYVQLIDFQILEKSDMNAYNQYITIGHPVFVQEDNMNEKICNHCGCSNPMENNYCASCGSPFEDRVPNAKRKGEGLSKKTMFLVSLAVTVVINVCMALLLNALVPMGNASCSHEGEEEVYQAQIY